MEDRNTVPTPCPAPSEDGTQGSTERRGHATHFATSVHPVISNEVQAWNFSNDVAEIKESLNFHQKNNKQTNIMLREETTADALR